MQQLLQPSTRARCSLQEYVRISSPSTQYFDWVHMPEVVTTHTQAMLAVVQGCFSKISE